MGESGMLVPLLLVWFDLMFPNRGTGGYTARANIRRAAGGLGGGMGGGLGVSMRGLPAPNAMGAVMLRMLVVVLWGIF